MTVRELIEKIKDYPDYEVCYRAYSDFNCLEEREIKIQHSTDPAPTKLNVAVVRHHNIPGEFREWTSWDGPCPPLVNVVIFPGN